MRVNAERGFNAIGAVATQKVASDALNLGYPSAYQSVYSAFKAPPRFFPEPAPASNHGFWRGDDLDAIYHESKMQDAHKMASAKVRSTQISRVRYCATPHGRGVLPPAILAQRRFANQSNGAYSASSARRDQAGAPFRDVPGDTLMGGVLRSPAGQRFGQEVLRRRVAQLDEIQQAQQDFGALGPLATQLRVPTGMAEMATETQLPSTNEASAIELNLLLEGVLNALYSADVATTGEASADQLTRFTLADATRALLLIFRTVPTAPTDFAEDLLGKVDTIVNLLNGVLDPETESAGMKPEAKQIALTLQILFTKLRAYLQRMLGGTSVERMEEKFNPLTGRSERVRVLSQEQGEHLSPKERVALSKNLVKELGFSKMLKRRDELGFKGDYNAMLSIAERNRLLNAQQKQDLLRGDIDEDDGNDDDDFDRPARAREDDAHRAEGGPRRGDRAGFDRDERQAFGENQGLVMGPAGAQFVANQFIDEDAPPALDAGDEAGAAGVAAPVRRVMPDDDMGVRGLFDEGLGMYDIAVGPRGAPPMRMPPAEVGEDAVLARTREIVPDRDSLPTTRQEYIALAQRLRDAGFNIRVSAVGEMKNIKKNFIRRLKL